MDIARNCLAWVRCPIMIFENQINFRYEFLRAKFMSGNEFEILVLCGRGLGGRLKHFQFSTSAKAKQFHQKSVGDMICSLAMSCDLRTTKISLHESELHPICKINKLLMKEGYKIHHFLIKNIDNYGQHQHEILYSARGLPTTFKLLLALLASLLPLIK